MADVEVTIFDLTKPVTQKGFGLPLVLDITKAVTYTEVAETSEIPEEILSSDMSYKMVQACLSQSPAPEKVAVYGSIVGVGNTITDILDDLMVLNNDFYFLLLADRTDANIQ